MLIHAVNHVHYGYVTAPKDLGFALESAKAIMSSVQSALSGMVSSRSTSPKQKFVFDEAGGAPDKV